MAYTDGQVVLFKGYSQDVEDPILTPGQRIKIRTINPDGGMIVDQLNDDGSVKDNVDVTETLFEEEIEPLPEAETATETAEINPAPADVADAPAADAAREAKTSKGKGKGIKATGGKKQGGKSSKAKQVTEPKGTEIATPDAADLDEAGPRSQLVRDALASVSSDEMAEGSAALLAAKTLVNRVDETYYTLGGVLAFIKETGVYKSLGFDGKRGFADYCKAELGTDYRKAQYLIDLYEKVQAAGLNETRLREIGWSKAVQIVRVGDVSLEKLSEDFDTLVDYAKDHTRDELISHITSSYEVATRAAGGSTGAGDQVNVSTFVFKLAADAADSANRALNHAKSVAGTEDLSEAFKYICDDWSMMTEGTAMDLDTAISVIEARFGVTLTQVDSPAPAEDATAAEGESEAEPVAAE